jgi:hypothetical protein
MEDMAALQINITQVFADLHFARACIVQFNVTLYEGINMFHLRRHTSRIK